MISHEDNEGGEDEDNEVIIQEKSHVFIHKDRRQKIQNLREMTEILIAAQNMLISFHFQMKKVDPNELKDLLVQKERFPSLDSMSEMTILSTNYNEFDGILQEINRKISWKNEQIWKENEEYQQSLKVRHDLTPENLIRSTIERRKPLLQENFTDIHAAMLMNKLQMLFVDCFKIPSVKFLDSQLSQLKFINGIFLNVNPSTPDMLEGIFKHSLNFIVTNKDLQKFFDMYMEYRLWKGKVQIFENLRKTHKVTNFIFQEKSRRLISPGCTIFAYLANNIAIESSPRIFINGTAVHLFEILSMEHLGNLIKEAKLLISINMSEIIYELESLLKKCYLLQQTLKYIYDFGLAKTGEMSLEIEFSLDEIMTQMDDCNLFFPIYHSFEAQRKKFASIRSVLGIANEFRFMPLPYANFEEDFYNKYKEKVLHDVYKFMKEKTLTKENLKIFTEEFLFFEKSGYNEKFPQEFKVLRDLNQHYQFLTSVLSLSRQWVSHKAQKPSLIPLIELKLQTNDVLGEAFNELETIEQIYKECDVFLEILLKDFANEEDTIILDWEKLPNYFNRETCLYGDEVLLMLVAKYKLLLWLKQIHRFLSENNKDYSRYHYLYACLRELIEKYGLEERLQIEVLYEQFLEFSKQINCLLDEISRKIQDRLKLKELIEENEIPSIEQNLKSMEEKFQNLGLQYPMAEKMLSDFKHCCLASKKAGVLYNMIVNENKKIDYNAMKILIDFARNFELCELFPSFINLRRIFDYYESLMSKVATLKDAFSAKKQILGIFKVPNLKVMQEKFIYSEKVTYSSKMIVFILFCVIDSKLRVFVSKIPFSFSLNVFFLINDCFNFC